MNKKQKIVLWIGVIVFCAIGILPWGTHWVYTYNRKTGDLISTSEAVYKWIQPPKLYIYWIMTTAVTGALIISLKESK